MRSRGVRSVWSVWPVVTVAAVGLGLAGCGGSDSTGATGPTVASSATASEPAPAGTTVPAPTAGPSTSKPGPTPRDRIVYDRSAEAYFSFITPSGNIRCAIYPSDADVKKGSVRCDVLSGTWKLPEIPAGCEFDWARSMLLEKKAQAGACVSDAVDIQGAETVRYGTGVRWHNITCYSEKAGLSCSNTDTRAGFTVSRTAYSLT